MKKTILALSSLVLVTLISTSAFALLLVPEAQCRGVMNNGPMTLSAHVPDAKFCSSAKTFESAVVIQTESLMPTVYRSVNRLNGVKSTHVSGAGKETLQLTFHVDSGLAELRLEGELITLECDYVEYEIDC